MAALQPVAEDVVTNFEKYQNVPQGATVARPNAPWSMREDWALVCALLGRGQQRLRAVSDLDWSWSCSGARYQLTCRRRPANRCATTVQLVSLLVLCSAL